LHLGVDFSENFHRPHGFYRCRAAAFKTSHAVNLGKLWNISSGHKFIHHLSDLSTSNEAGDVSEPGAFFTDVHSLVLGFKIHRFTVLLEQFPHGFEKPLHIVPCHASGLWGTNIFGGDVGPLLAHQVDGPFLPAMFVESIGLKPLADVLDELMPSWRCNRWSRSFNGDGPETPMRDDGGVDRVKHHRKLLALTI